VRPLRSLRCGVAEMGRAGDSVRTLPQSSLPQSQPGDGGEISLALQRPQAHPAVDFSTDPRLRRIAANSSEGAGCSSPCEGRATAGSPSPASSVALRGRRRVRQQSR
jgi:hypothetical protein